MYSRLLLPATVFLAARTYAQTTNAPCKNVTDTQWSFNSLGQSPCLMGAYMMGACQPGGSYDVQGLPDVNFRYNGPTADQATICSCSSISYSLMSACGFCQGAGWPEWSAWTTNCSSELVHNGSYPHPIPKGTRSPDWAFVPIQGFLDEFDAVQGMDIGDKLESTGTATPTGTPVTSAFPTDVGGSVTHTAGGASQTGSTSESNGQSLTGSASGTLPTTDDSSRSTGTGSSSPTSGSSTGDHKTNIAAVVGGIIAGLIAFASVIGLVVYFCILRKRRGVGGPNAVLPGMAQTKPGYERRPLVNYDVPSTPGVDASDPFSATPTSPSQWAGTASEPVVYPTPSPSPPVAPVTPPIQSLREAPPMRLYDPADPTTFPPTPAPQSQSSLFDMTQVTYPNVAHQPQQPIPEL
ncbi:hypothetical protein OH76DRAFT_1414254 [Lentinus brumalis]|uniref:Mid2 domain-containing protein n=1 Tax=Lentinus brumalis TaxID=2498619 RepID=A0A371DW62_9APHY|nr:hypothetical protein OH76DRAFT_1414254 [Polyporus brumalis]